MTSTTGSMPQSRSAVRRAAVMTHGRAERIGPALERLEALADRLGVELLLAPEEVDKHGRPDGDGPLHSADLAIVLGGDGTMLRALNRFLDTDVAVIGVNFGRVGFLSAMGDDELESGLERALAGEYVVVELPALACELGGDLRYAVNDVVAHSSTVG